MQEEGNQAEETTMGEAVSQAVEPTPTDSGKTNISVANWVVNFVFASVTGTLCAVIVGMVVALMIALFSDKVDNTDIFKMITPAFQTIIGGFIGILAGLKISSSKD